MIQWTEPSKGHDAVRYDHVYGRTPFGDFLITWKSWKDMPAYTIDDTPWNEFLSTHDSLDDAKNAAEEEYNRRLEEANKTVLDAHTLKVEMLERERNYYKNLSETRFKDWLGLKEAQMTSTMHVEVLRETNARLLTHLAAVMKIANEEKGEKEKYIDENGNTWFAPTPEAYYRVCKARDIIRERLKKALRKINRGEA